MLTAKRPKTRVWHTLSIFMAGRRSAHDDNRLLAGGRRSDDIESGSNWADVFALPPLPIPDYSTMRSEACYGNFLVLALIVFFVTPVHMGYTNDTIFYLYLIYAEAVIAIICLLGLMWGDPGTIKRTPETCFPLPAQVSAQLAHGKRLDAGRLGNIHEGGRTFCIRCLVWRPDDTVHHCRTCQRCVVDFDHHCGVFGRCIAGEGYAGNMGYFKTLILMFFMGFGTWIFFMQKVYPASSFR